VQLVARRVTARARVRHAARMHFPLPKTASRRVLPFLAATLLSVAAYAGQGRLGFSTEVETDGFFSTTLKRISITAVVPDAPAQKAGLQAGDEVTAVNDVPVVGTSGLRVKEIVQGTKPGDHLRLKVHRADGEHVIDIVAGEAAAH
jgi:S1-C subfamily serine protease